MLLICKCWVTSADSLWHKRVSWLKVTLCYFPPSSGNSLNFLYNARFYLVPWLAELAVRYRYLSKCRTSILTTERGGQVCIALLFRTLEVQCSDLKPETVCTKVQRVFSQFLYTSDIQPFSCAYPKICFLFNFVPAKLLVHNSSYTWSIIYIWNKLNKLHPK